MDFQEGRATEVAHVGDAEAALLAMLDRVRSGEVTGWAGVELAADGGGRLHVHGSACDDRWRTTGALTDLLHGVQHADHG